MPRLPARSIVLLLLVATASVIVPRADAQQRLRKLVEQRRNSHQATDLPAGTRVRRDIAYGPDPAQRYDVYLPANAKADAPILFMVHGGGWRRGDKAYSNVVGNKAAHWLAKGHVFVSANNRLVPAADPLTQARDIAAAVASVQKHAPQWGADPKRTILMGHSAGAHLVALLGADPRLLADAGAVRPLGVVSLDSGALDVPALMGQRRVPKLYQDAFGADPAYWRSASPQQQLTRNALPMLLVCASERQFPTSPCDEARKFARQAEALRVPMAVQPEPLDHGEINKTLGLPSDYTGRVGAWIDRLTGVR